MSRSTLVFLVSAVTGIGGCASSASPAGYPGERLPAEAAVGRVLDEPSPERARWVEATMASLSLREEVGQLIIPWISGAYASTSSPEFLELASWVEELGIGGVSISIGLPHSYAAKLNALQARARIPLLVTADFENGGPGMRINHSYALPSLLPQGGGTSFPPTMAFGAIGDERFAWEYGFITALEARAVGVHVLFAPVLDVNSNPDNPVINTRSFGEDPAAVARLGTAFIRGARAGGALTTAKHFPGHGDTRTDSHIELPVIPADRDRLEEVELVPFRRAVESGVDGVMTAHVAVPGILGPDALPATLSPYFMTDLLRRDMDFGGVLFTDALRMRAISDRYGEGEAAVLALEAGADVLLSPGDLGVVADAVVAAVREGRVSRERVRASVRRILDMKARLGLHESRYVDLEGVDEVVGAGSHVAFADTAAFRSIALPRDRGEIVPVDPESTRRILSVTHARRTDVLAGRELNALLVATVDELVRVHLDDSSGPDEYEAAARRIEDVDLVLVSPFVSPRSGSGTVAVPEALSELVSWSASQKPTAVLSFGNPYLLSAFPGVGTYMIAWGGREVSQRAAVRALFGETAVTGTLPISLPPFHRLGEGENREATGPVVGSRARRDALAEAGFVPAGEAARERAVEAGAVTAPQELRARVAHLLEEVGGWQVSGGEVDPATVGMDPVGLARLDSLILEAVADSVSPGVALAVGRHGRLVRLRGYGRLDWGEEAPPVTESSIYDMASVTKVVGTTTGTMILVEEGRLDLDAPVVRYLPWWDSGDPAKTLVTVRQLLLHRAGLIPFRTFFHEIEGREAYRDTIAAEELIYAPGDSTAYSDLGIITLGWIIEEITGTGLDAFLAERVFQPLGMQDTGFLPDPWLLPRIAPTEVDTTYRHTHVHGTVHDENAHALGGVAGHAGLFSSARDLSVFAQMMLDGGRAGPCLPGSNTGVPCSSPRTDEVRIVAPETVAAFVRPHDDASPRGLGWYVPYEGSAAGDYLTERAFGHTGYTGTSIFLDRDLDLFVVLLTTRVNPTRNNQKHVPLRRVVHDLAARAITDRPVARRRW